MQNTPIFYSKHDAKRIAVIITSGSLYIALALTGLLTIHDITNNTLFSNHFWIGCVSILYIFVVKAIAVKGMIRTAHWLLIILFEGVAVFVLLEWGLLSAAGILAASFTLLLPSVLMAPRYIPLVAFITFSIVAITHMLHVSHLVEPSIYKSSYSSSLLDIITYSIALAIFVLVSWISSRNASISLARALCAENELRQQKEMLSIELDKQSTQLRQAQLQQIQQLYRFAVIGQSATLTLHELSSHLSILNLDIDDIKQQLKYSDAIESAENGISHINQMVREARAQIDNRNHSHYFNAIPVINRVVKDFSPKFQHKHIKLFKRNSGKAKTFTVLGDPVNLAHCISILLNNALDACSETPQASVAISINVQKDSLSITVSDSGPGIPASLIDSLFEPLESQKPSGLGVGLYIAKHLIETHFKGQISSTNAKKGAVFEITLTRSRNKPSPMSQESPQLS